MSQGGSKLIQSRIFHGFVDPDAEENNGEDVARNIELADPVPDLNKTRLVFTVPKKGVASTVRIRNHGFDRKPDGGQAEKNLSPEQDLGEFRE